LILDEPTAVLTPPEVEQLFSVLRGLCKEGVTIVLITHKLDEVIRIADEITVMRAGKRVSVLDGKTARPEEIAQAMVGRPVLLEVVREEEVPGQPILEVVNVHATSPRGTTALAGVSLTVREREIVGIAGVVGNGQSELLDVIAGTRRIERGAIRLFGAELHARSVATRQEQGVAHIPEDRHARGLVLDFTVMQNTLLGRQHEFSRHGLIAWDAVRTQTRQLITSGDVRPADENLPIRNLSGGNQQKVVVGRELLRSRARLLLCGQPTRGVDVGAIELIHRRILETRKKGWGVLLVSAELSELRALSDRLLVFYGGRVVAELSAAELRSEEAMSRVGELMTGARKGAA
jgi:simple sugar transport system ATP-binding protein